MTSVVMICKDRPRLTEQTLRTLYESTPRSEFNLTIVDDGSQPETQRILKRYERQGAFLISAGGTTASGCLGALKNAGVNWSEQKFGRRGEWLCVVDNDIAFLPGWLEKCINLGRHIEQDRNKPVIIGSHQHPYHGTNADHFGIFSETDAVAGYLHFMSWQTWDQFGPYDANAQGICQSEDYAICRRVVEAGGLVGYVHPPVISHCGITNSEGKPAIGSEHFGTELWPRIPGVLYL